MILKCLISFLLLISGSSLLACSTHFCVDDPVIDSLSGKSGIIAGESITGNYTVFFGNKEFSSIFASNLTLVNNGNHFHKDCVSADGRVRFIIDLGTKKNRTVELIVDGETYGAGLLGMEISEENTNSITTYTELDHDRTLWALTERHSDGSLTLLDGLNPATGKSMQTATKLSCTRVQIP